MSIDYIKAYLSNKVHCSTEQEQLYLRQLKMDLARYHGELSLSEAVTLYTATLKELMELLGASNKYTLQLRIEFSTHLHRMGKYADAVEVCLDALDAASEAPQLTSQAKHRRHPFGGEDAATADTSRERFVELIQEWLPRLRNDSDKLIRTKAQRVLQMPNESSKKW